MKKILVVDDSQEVNYFIKLTLAADGFEVTTATSGQEALKLLETLTPDLIIVDIVMPVLDGLEFCRCLKVQERNKTTPVVLISGKRLEQTDIEKALMIWADRFLAKPVEMVELKLVIYELLAEGGEELTRRMKMIDHRINGAVESYKKVVRVMDNLFMKFSEAVEIDITGIKQTVTDFIDTFIKNQETLYNLMNSYVIDSSTALHSVNAMMVALRIGQGLKFSHNGLAGLGFAALIHEVHPRYDQILIKLGITGIPPQERAKYDAIIQISDRFEMLTSIRVSQPPLPPQVAIKRIMDDKDKYTDTEIIKNFLAYVTPYPLGCFVKLSNGEVGKVKRTNTLSPFRPVVDVVIDRFNNVMPEHRELDLSADLQVFIQRVAFREEVYDTVRKFAHQTR